MTELSEKTQNIPPKERKRRRRKYREMLPLIREVAKKFGYAIGVHGSERRDFDLIAAPWADEAVPGTELVKAITDALVIAHPENSFIRCIDDNGSGNWPNTVYKPHGRLAFTIITGFGRYGWSEFIDLSVMPKEK